MEETSVYWDMNEFARHINTGRLHRTVDCVLFSKVSHIVKLCIDISPFTVTKI